MSEITKVMTQQALHVVKNQLMQQARHCRGNGAPITASVVNSLAATLGSKTKCAWATPMAKLAPGRCSRSPCGSRFALLAPH